MDLNKNNKTDICIIGAGPVGLFTIFQCGMLGMKCHVVDSLDMIGGQCASLYPEKPIYDIPAYPKIMAQELIDNLAQQAAPFCPVYHLSQTVIDVSGNSDIGFTIKTSRETVIQAKAIIIAAGAGAFGPNKPPLKDIHLYEKTSIFYMVEKRSDFANKNIIIAGGGDSAVDWTLSLAEIASSLTLIHRRDVFKASQHSLDKMRELEKCNKIKIITPAQPIGLIGENNQLSALQIRDDKGVITDLKCDVFLPFYGLVANLSVIAKWGIDIVKNHIIINQETTQTNIHGIYAVGDVASYAHKIKLILTGFAEAATAAHQAYHLVFKGKALHFEYSTSKEIPSL